MKRINRDRATIVAAMQTLEDRRLLTVFGTAWPDERNLSISFPIDGVQVGSYPNEINELLDPIAARQDWQELALRAYQTWAVHADINIGLRNDYNIDFGAPGMTVGDPRFGEFRFGAIPQQGLIANSVPFQAIAGTYSGDLILNSNQQFTFDNWDNNTGPDPATILPNQRDLFSLFLHETGNTLGLDDNLMDWSVMFRQYTVPKGILAAEDIASIEALYGQRSDPYELVDNGQIQFASLIPTPVGLDPTHEVIRTRGSMRAGDDVDTYKIVPTGDTATLRVHAKGISLLQSQFEVLDSFGQVIAQTNSASVFDNDNELTINGLLGHSEVYLRVSAIDPNDVYSAGDYWIEIDYREAAQRAADPSPGQYDSGPDTLFANYDLVDSELGFNDSIADATSLTPSSGDRYQFESSVSSTTDIDYLKIASPTTVAGRLVVHVTGVGLSKPDVVLSVVDSAGQAVGTAARLRADGTFTIEVATPQASQDYFLRVSVDPSSAVGVGNYVAVAEFEAPASQMHELASGDLTAAADKFVRWTADKTKLFRFDLASTSDDAGQAVRVTIYDAHTREIKAVSVAQAGLTRNTLAWLQQGEYILRFTAVSAGELPVTGAHFSLTVDGISDDQDEDPDDPADDPYHDPYDYSSGYYDSSYYHDPEYEYYEYYSYN